jgi:hypothetical protein
VYDWHAVNVGEEHLPDNLHRFATSNLAVRLLSTPDGAHATGVRCNTTAVLVAVGSGAGKHGAAPHPRMVAPPASGTSTSSGTRSAAVLEPSTAATRDTTSAPGVHQEHASPPVHRQLHTVWDVNAGAQSMCGELRPQRCQV